MTAAPGIGDLPLEGGDDGGERNAMTEIALALAMAFYSLMLLTMVSMAPVRGGPAASAATPAAPGAIATLAGPGPGAQRLSGGDVLVIHHRGRLLGADLAPLEAGAALARARSGGGRLGLAVAPGLPMAELGAARALLGDGDVVVGLLDAAWLARLAQSAGGVR